MSRLWSKKRRQRKQSRIERQQEKYFKTLEYRLLETLLLHAGERGHGEGALETLERIIRERDRALLVLGLEKLQFEPGPFVGE